MERYPLGRAIDRSFPSRDRQKVKVNSRTTVLFGETGTSPSFFFALRVVPTLTPVGLCRDRLVGGGADRGAQPDERDSRRTALPQGQPGRGAGHGRPALAALHPAIARAAIRQPARCLTLPDTTRHYTHRNLYAHHYGVNAHQASTC